MRDAGIYSQHNLLGWMRTEPYPDLMTILLVTSLPLSFFSSMRPLASPVRRGSFSLKIPPPEPLPCTGPPAEPDGSASSLAKRPGVGRHESGHWSGFLRLGSKALWPIPTQDHPT